LRPHTYGTLIGLLASTGLRIGETIRLDREDVRLEEVPPHILVRETKFRKTRIVPVHPSVATKLHHYLDQRREFGYGGFTPAFFVSERGMRLSYHAILETWNILLESAGIHPTADGRRPTIHALRHSFAVGRLLEWQRNGADITANLPHLSVYLGHTEPKNTYWYLTATPELLGAAAVVFERYAGEGDIR
jgi:integrase